MPYLLVSRHLLKNHTENMMKWLLLRPKNEETGHVFEVEVVLIEVEVRQHTLEATNAWISEGEMKQSGLRTTQAPGISPASSSGILHVECGDY